MSRSLWKPLHNDKNFIKLEKNFNYKIYNRNTSITPQFLNQTVSIYNGMKFFEILITEKMLGYKFGEFAPTRKIPLHKKKSKHQKNKTKNSIIFFTHNGT